jgi:hypothetical protein
MKQARRIHLMRKSLLAMGLVCILTLITMAADGDFGGKWKGETKPQAPTGADVTARGGPGGGGGAAPRGGGGRGGAGRGGGFGGGAAQKVTLNLKRSKDNKVSGNITFGEGQTEDVKDGRVTGNSITFKSGRAPQIYEYIGELKGDELILTRVSSDGRTRPQEMVLKK